MSLHLQSGGHTQRLKSHLLWEEEPVGDSTWGHFVRGSSTDSSTNTDFTTSNPASTCPRFHPCPALHPLPSRHEDQSDWAKLSCRDQASSASDKCRLAVWSSSEACISKGPQILAGMFCYLLVQVLIVEFQQEPGTVEIEFTAVTSSPGQAAVCRVRVEV